MQREIFPFLVTCIYLGASHGAVAQVLPLDCETGSAGPTINSLAPYWGGMCDLGSLRLDNLGFSNGVDTDASGSAIIGTAYNDDGAERAFHWVLGEAELQDLGSLRTDNGGNSSAVAMSADGTTVVGEAHTQIDSFESRAFRWVAGGGGMQDLGSLREDKLGASYAHAVNGDGSVVVGRAVNDLNESRAFRWSEDDGMVDLGTLKPDNSGGSTAILISSDGTIIVGQSNGDSPGQSVAFRWTASSGMQSIGGLRTSDIGWSNTFDMTPDGNVIVGYSLTDDDSYRAFLSVGGNQMIDLGSLLGDNQGISRALAVSDDGGVIVGDSYDANGKLRAYRWSDAATGMVDLGTLRTGNVGQSDAYRISADGTVIAGTSETDSGDWRAYRWVEGGTGMLDLGSLRSDSLGYSFVNGMSADGSVIVGSAETDQGTYRAFIWRTQMQDFANTALSFGALANDTEIAVAQQQGVLGQLLDEACLADEGQSCFRTSGWVNAAGSTDAQDIDNRASGKGTLTYGRGINAQTTFGGTLTASRTELGRNGFALRTGVGASLWAQYNQNAVSRSGWHAAASLGFDGESGEITRGRNLDDVMLASGEADLQTYGARATLAYGLQSQNWLITPSTTLSQFRSGRSAYAEEGSDFNASYDEMMIDRSTATLAMSAERKVGARGTLSIEAGIDHDLSRDKVVLSGTSAVPGMENFSVPSTLSPNKTRWALGFGYRHELNDNRSISGNLNAGQSDFGTAIQTAIGASYDIKF